MDQLKNQILKFGDVITEVEGKAVTSIDEINNIKNTFSIGDTISLKVYHNNDYRTIKITLAETPEEKTTQTKTNNNNSNNNFYSNPFGF